MSETMPDNSGPESDATEIDEEPEFEPEPYCSDEPNDFAGYELLCVLRTPGGRFAATKSYRPDPTGLRAAVKAEDYKSGTQFLCTLTGMENLEQFFELLKELSTDPTAFIVRGIYFDGVELKRHRPTGITGYVVYRRSVKVHGTDGYFVEWDRRLQMLDLDAVILPEGFSVVSDPGACVKWAVDNLLPPEFANASFVYQLSSSAGLTKLDNELNVHLWFITEQDYGNDNLRAWARWWNAKQQRKIIDPALFTAVQPHYTSAPELLDGLIDPLAGRRLGLVYRRDRTVRLHMPSTEELDAEQKSRQKRATSQYNRACKSEQPRASRSSQPDDGDQTGQQEEPAFEREGDAIPGGPYFDAINIGQGWRGYLLAIGFEGHIRTQIRAAIGSYFHEQGSRGDRDLLKGEIERAVEESRFLDCGEPWSRPRKDARDYLTAPSGNNSNVDEMITAIAALQAEKERFASEPYEPTWELPKITADQAFMEIQSAVGQMMKDAREWKDRRRKGLEPWILFEQPARIAVNCSTGTGKTEAMIDGIVDLLRAEQTARVAIAVPTHKLGQGLAERINTTYGSEIAAEWYGTDHCDPLAPDEKMCRLAETAKELISLGGKLQLLCSRRGEQMEYCPHHPAVAGAKGCGYQRQQTLQARNRTRVWIIPATMLSIAPTVGLQRVAQLLEGDFDLLVIDEAPWSNLLPDEPTKVPVEWLSTVWWTAQDSRATESQKRSVIDILGKIYAAFAGQSADESSLDVLAAAGIEQSDISPARRAIWKFKANLRELVKPGSKHRRLKKALSTVASRNQRVIAVVEALYVIMLHASGRLAPSGLMLTEDKGVRYLSLRRRQDIHEAWLKAPTLYLDAADIGSFEIAKAWLPDLVLKVNARAKAPHMRVTQLVDSSMAYRKLIADETDEQVAIRNNQERLARIILSRGPDGLVICPKKLRTAWERAKSLPPGWMVWNFGAVRGRDEAREVPRLIIVSRPLPRPSDAEIMAETIFVRRVERLPPGEQYPKIPVGRLMADGTGRRALASRHPDPLVEAVRFAICEGELLQAVGRGRGVRRTVQSPLDVLILTNVPIPIPVDEVIAGRELSDTAGPLGLLAAKGVVPLDYGGIAAAFPEWLGNATRVRNWFQYRPEARSRLRSIKRLAEKKGVVDACEFSGISNRESPIEDSTKLAAYRYRRGGLRQSNLVLVHGAVHTDARAAVEAVVGPVHEIRLVKDAPRRRPRRRRSSSDDMIAALLDQHMGVRSAEARSSG